MGGERGEGGGSGHVFGDGTRNRCRLPGEGRRQAHDW